MTKVDLKELSEQMDFMFDGWSYFVKKSTGEIISIDDRYMQIAEDPNDPLISEMLDWEREEISRAEKIVRNYNDYISFPRKYDLNEYSIMEEFSSSYPVMHISDCLSTAISGKGAFRRFKDTVNRFGIDEEWYSYKKTVLTEFAKKWCEKNGLKYETEDKQ